MFIDQKPKLSRLTIPGMSLMVFIGWVVFSCNNSPKTEKEEKQPESAIIEDEKPKVEVMTLKKSDFYKETLCNGKLSALQKADLRFKVSETIQKIYVKNGDNVQEGALLASLDNYTYGLRLKRSLANYEKARVAMQDALIAQGCNTMDSTKVQPNVWKMAMVRSGAGDAKFDLESAQYDYQCTMLKAPFTGTICNLKVKQHNLPGAEPICTLVDNSMFEASFQIMESELENIKAGQPVVIIPFTRDSAALQGIVSEVNPLVDDNGLVTVKAKVPNRRGNLCEGMNVRVVVRKVVPNQLVVPKSAVVLRTGKEVAFIYEKGRAVWKYVTTGDENTTSYLVTDGLEVGWQVITSGNLNIGHDAEVEVVNNERMNK